MSKVNEEALDILKKFYQPKMLTKYTESQLAQERAQLLNLTSAMARQFAEEGRVAVMLTMTFGGSARLNLTMSLKQIKKIAHMQYDSLMAFLYKLRHTKKFKEKIHYFSVIELQNDMNLHIHAHISLGSIDELNNFLEFFYNFKKQYSKPYTHQGKEVLPIGRSHIGVSSIHKKVLLKKFNLKAKRDKNDRNRIQYYAKGYDSRYFTSGQWSSIEFYTASMMENRYGEQITRYLTKTLDNQYHLDTTTIKEGVSKSQFSHDAKTLINNSYLSNLQLSFLRLVGRVYTHSQLPFPTNLYQRYYKNLIAYNPNYKIYYNCIEDLRNGHLVIYKNRVFDADGIQIAPIGESYEQ